MSQNVFYPFPDEHEFIKETAKFILKKSCVYSALGCILTIYYIQIASSV